MAYVPGCNHDIFVSYASENNRDGWVEQFVNALGCELSELLGMRRFNPKESIFFDRRDLAVAQSFPGELATAARGSAIIVPILSPGYLTSPWCNRERVEFFSKLPDGAHAAGCLAPILVRPVDAGEMDTLYRNAQMVSFLSSDGQTPFAAGSHDWIAQVCRFAWQLKSALQKLRRCCKPVYLGRAPATERAVDLRAWCGAELERRHLRSVPESLPALDDPATVQTDLREAGLAIHFLGGADSMALDAIEMSVDICRGPTILYQAFSAKLSSQEKLWLDYFERELPMKPGCYQRLSGKSEQELLSVIDEQIMLVRTDVTKRASSTGLAVVCEEPDLSSVRELGVALRARTPVEVRAPDFLGMRMKSMERLRKWHGYLSCSNILLFYYGLANRDRLELIWQTAQQQELNARCYWFLAAPDLEDKRKIHPDALWNLDQVIRFVEERRTLQQP